jgi:arginase family enzyme
VLCEGALEEIHDRLREVVAAVCLAGLVPLVIGGGHDITYPVVGGAALVHGALGALNVDAHLDVRPPNPLRNSGTSFRMAVDEGLVEGARLVELGVQEFANAQAHVGWVREQGGDVVPLEETRRVGMERAVAVALYRASSNGAAPLYATLDMDAVSAADAPGVSAPMPDGISPADLLAAARAIGSHPRTVALDIAELNPAFDIDGRTARLAARAALAFISAVAGRE